MLPKLVSPTFQITIPSTNSKAQIRPMLVAEDKILLIAKESREPVDIFKAIRQVVGNCLIGANVDSLALFDLEYIFLKIRSVSISNIIKVSYKDAEDDNVYNFEVNLDKDVSVKTDTQVSSLIEFENGSNKIAIVLKYPSATLYDDDSFLKTDIGNFLENLVYKCIDKIVVNGQQVEMPEVSVFRAWVETFPLDIYNQIRNYFSNLPSLYCELNYTNSKGSQRKIVLSTLEDFFTLR